VCAVVGGASAVAEGQRALLAAASASAAAAAVLVGCEKTAAGACVDAGFLESSVQAVLALFEYPAAADYALAAAAAAAAAALTDFPHAAAADYVPAAAAAAFAALTD